MTGNNKVWRAPVAGLATVAMLATFGVSAMTASAAATTYKLTKVYADGTTASSQVSEIDATALKPTSNVPAGETSTGWYTAEGIGNGEKVQPGTELKSDTTIYEHSGSDLWTIDFAGAGSYVSGVSEYSTDGDTYSTTVVKGDKLSAWQIPSDDNAGDNKIVDGWNWNGETYTDADMTGDLSQFATVSGGVENNNIEFSANAVAAWGVTFHPDNAVSGVAGLGYYGLYVDGAQLSGPYTVDVKAGSAYTGIIPTAKINVNGQMKMASKWKTGTASTSTAVDKLDTFDPAAPVTSDLNLYPYDAVVYYTVTFHYQDAAAETVKTAEVVDGQAVQAPATPTRAASDQYEYEFGGWYTDTTYQTAFDTTTKYASTTPRDLYAKWNITSVKVTFLPNHDNVKAIETRFKNGDEFTTPAMERDGYEFACWADAPSSSVSLTDLEGYSVKIDQTNYGVAAAATLKVVTSSLDDGTQSYTLNAQYTANWKSLADALRDYEDLVDLNLPDTQKLYTAESYAAYVKSFKTDYMAAKESAMEGGYSRAEYDTLLAQLKEMQSKLVEVGGTSLYRVYNPNNGDHYFTINKKEASRLVNLGWQAEGAPYKVVNLSRKDKFGTAIYSAYNPNTGEHLLTEKGEAEALAKVGWVNEGPKFYTVQNGSKDVTRVYNPNTNGPAHLYTNASEANGLAALGWSIDNGGAPVFTLD